MLAMTAEDSRAHLKRAESQPTLLLHQTRLPPWCAPDVGSDVRCEPTDCRTTRISSTAAEAPATSSIPCVHTLSVLDIDARSTLTLGTFLLDIGCPCARRRHGPVEVIALARLYCILHYN
jgi:hypothetical protein